MRLSETVFIPRDGSGLSLSYMLGYLEAIYDRSMRVVGVFGAEDGYLIEIF